MEQQPFFSIITPVYNCKRFLKKCIQSVLDQTYLSWELILIDDGSTDSSGEICESFSYDSRVKVIHQSNAGELASRAKGNTYAKGVYALGLDADDYLDKTCLETIKKAIDISGNDMIFFGYRNFGCQQGYVKSTLKAGKEYSRREILKEVIGQTNHSLCNKAIRLDIMKQTEYEGIKKKLSINADYAQIISILCNIKSGYVIDDILYNYRVHNKSASHTCKMQHIHDTGFVTSYVIRKLKEHSLMDTEIYNIINYAYLKMVAPRLMLLFRNNEITKKDCKKIHKSKAYISSKNAETRHNFNKFDFLFLKLFRYRQYWMLKVMLQLQKL